MSERDHTVAVDVTGLEPDTFYYYGFSAEGQASSIARTRTLPRDGVDHLKFAVVSCASYNSGFFNVYGRIAERDDLNFVLHLGDYVYETPNVLPPHVPAPPEMGRPFDPDEETVTLADYRRSGVTTGAHAMTHLRDALRRRGCLTAAELREAPDGRRVRTAGCVIVRQRPGSAKGFCFLTLEDETGTSNAVLTPAAFRRFRVPLHAASIVEISGPVQNVDGVVHVRVRSLEPVLARAELPGSHDYR